MDKDILEKEELELTADSIFSKICYYGESYHEVRNHGMLGINVYDELEAICEKMEKIIFPAISDLTEKELRSLLKKLKNKYLVNDGTIDNNFLTRSAECVKNAIVEVTKGKTI